MTTFPHVTVYGTVDRLEEAVADFIAATISNALKDRGLSVVVLSGGETPRGVYRKLGASPAAERIDWEHVHLCFGDERMVPPYDPQSNYHMVHEELLSRIAIPGRNVHRIEGETAPEDAACRYAADLGSLLAGSSERPDLVLLGVGDDGHTASLFPGTTALDEHGEDACAVFVPRLNAWRVTMTLPRLNSARNVVFLAAGDGKAGIVRTVLGVREPLIDVPATMIRPSDGTVDWMLDSGAAQGLGNEIVVTRL